MGERFPRGSLVSWRVPRENETGREDYEVNMRLFGAGPFTVVSLEDCIDSEGRPYYKAVLKCEKRGYLCLKGFSHDVFPNSTPEPFPTDWLEHARADA